MICMCVAYLVVFCSFLLSYNSTSEDLESNDRSLCSFIDELTRFSYDVADKMWVCLGLNVQEGGRIAAHEWGQSTIHARTSTP